MGGKETDYSGAWFWVGWSCVRDICERGEVETGF